MIWRNIFFIGFIVVVGCLLYSSCRHPKRDVIVLNSNFEKGNSYPYIITEYKSNSEQNQKAEISTNATLAVLADSLHYQICSLTYGATSSGSLYADLLKDSLSAALSYRKGIVVKFLLDRKSGSIIRIYNYADIKERLKQNLSFTYRAVIPNASDTEIERFFTAYSYVLDNERLGMQVYLPEFSLFFQFLGDTLEMGKSGSFRKLAGGITVTDDTASETGEYIGVDKNRVIVSYLHKFTEEEFSSYMQLSKVAIENYTGQKYKDIDSVGRARSSVQLIGNYDLKLKQFSYLKGTRIIELDSLQVYDQITIAPVLSTR